MEVTSIINFHREDDYAECALKSLEAASIYAIERGCECNILMILDRPSEVVLEIAKRFEETSRVSSALVIVNNGSLGLSRNDGVVRASGRYVMLCDGDDLCSVNMIFDSWIEVKSYLEDKGRRVCCIPEYIYEFGKWVSLRKFYSSRFFNIRDFAVVHPFCSHLFIETEILRKNLFRDLSPTSGFAFEDWDLNVRLISSGVEVEVAKGTTLYYRKHDQDMETLADLTKRAKGDERSINEFARVCGVSPSTISRLINKKNTTPNKDSLIKAIADNAVPESGVTLDMLLQAHGLEKISVYEGKERKSESVLEDIVIDRLLCDITQLGYKCEIEKEKNIIYTTDEIRFRADFVIKTELLKEYGIREWAFDVYVGPHRPVMQKLSWFFGCCYVNSLRDNGTKLSLVLSNKDEFDAAKRRLGTIKIHDIISIILINEENWELEEEFVIPTYDKVDMPTLGGATYGR